MRNLLFRLMSRSVILAALFIFVGIGISLNNFDRSKQRAFDAIRIGEHNQDLITELGGAIRLHVFPQANRDDLPFHLINWMYVDVEGGLDVIHEGEGFWGDEFLDPPLPENTAYVLVWINDMNWFYLVCFDQNHRVVSKGEGRS